MTRIILFRHGRTARNRTERFRGRRLAAGFLPKAINIIECEDDVSILATLNDTCRSDQSTHSSGGENELR